MGGDTGADLLAPHPVDGDAGTRLPQQPREQAVVAHVGRNVEEAVQLDQRIMRRPRLRDLDFEPAQLDRHRREEPVDLGALSLELSLADDLAHVGFEQPPPLPLQLGDPRPQPLDLAAPVVGLGLERRLGRRPGVDARDRSQQGLGDGLVHVAIGIIIPSHGCLSCSGIPPRFAPLHR
jgi:hypothetical protein